MKTIDIKQDQSEYRFDIHDMEATCTHADTTIDKACCSTVGSSGYIECGCNGQDEVVCNNPDCTGIDDSELDDMFEKLAGGGSDCS